MVLGVKFHTFDLSLKLLGLTFERLCLSIYVQVGSILLKVHGLEGSISKQDTNVQTWILVLVLEDHLDPCALDSLLHGLLVLQTRHVLSAL